jgi:hypothetical protein
MKNCYSFADAYDTEEEIPRYVLDGVLGSGEP